MRVISRKRYAYYVVLLMCSVVLLYFLWGRSMRFFLVPSASMEPLLYEGDYIATLDESSYDRGDVVVFRDPAEPGTYLVKRVVAVGGDEVAMYGGALHVNDAYVSEPYIKEYLSYSFGTYRVPVEHLFVLGDNRPASYDSSAWLNPNDGLDASVPVESVIGRVRGIYLPVRRVQGISSYRAATAAGRAL